MISVGQRLHELLLKKQVAIGDRRPDPLVVELPRPIDFVSQARGQIAALSPDPHGSLVVQLDLGDEQLCVPPSALRIIACVVAESRPRSSTVVIGRRRLAGDETHRLRRADGRQ